MVTRVSALFLIVVALSPACAGDKSDRQANLDGRADYGCKRAPVAENPVTHDAGALRIERVVDIPTTVPTGYLALWDSYLAYTPRNKEAVVCDLATGRVQRVAHTSAPKGHLGWLQGSGKTVVFSDYSNLPDLAAPNPGAAWVVYAYDLSTKKRRELARSDGGASERFGFLPTPTVDGRWVTWLQATVSDDKPVNQLVTFDLELGRRHVIPTDSTPGTAIVSGGAVYYNAEVTSGRLELLRVPPAGTDRPTVVPTDGRTSMPHARGGLVVWQEYVPNSAASGDNQYPLVARLMSDDRLVRIGRGNGPVSSGSLVIWYSQEQGLLVKDPRRPVSEPPTVLAAPGTVDFGARWDAYGTTVAWVAIDDPLKKPNDRVIRLVRVSS